MAAAYLAFGLGAAARLSRPAVRSLPCCRRRLSRSRFICTSAAPKKRVVFLGTPPVAAETLRKLCAASEHPSASFTIPAVVTKPPAPVGRKRVLTKSPVHQLAEQLSIPTVFTPVSARDPAFLEQFSALSPDLCVTAAYGNFLPKAFLSVPPFGTLNIHPSLLPAFRGAAPVPRALEAGVTTTGVCVLKTVLKMDAGPLVARRERHLTGDEQAPDLLEELLAEGADALLDVLPKVWDGSAEFLDQDEAHATHAAKISKEEGRLSFTENACIVHNKVRAFAGWPGTWADFLLFGEDTKAPEEVRLKILRTVVLREEGGMCLGVHEVTFGEERNCLTILCDDGSKIGALQVQPPGRKPMDARTFWNGLRGKTVERKRVPH